MLRMSVNILPLFTSISENNCLLLLLLFIIIIIIALIDSVKASIINYFNSRFLKKKMEK